MTVQSTVAPRLVLADALRRRTLAGDAVLVLGGIALVAAQVAVPLWPVPITGQTLAVLLVGTVLGPVRGGVAMVGYLLIGGLGVPIFSDASSGWSIVLGPSGGYIVGFVASAVLTGALARRAWDRRFIGAIASFAAGTVVTFAIGMAWLAAVLHANIEQTLEWGLYPFIVGGAIKAVLAAGIVRAVWALVPAARRGPARKR